MPTQNIFVGTLHQYASHFLRQVGANILGLSPHYSIWDQEQGNSMIREALQADPSLPQASASQIAEILHWNGLNQANLATQAVPAEHASWYQIVDIYTAEKRRQNALDLDDLLPTAIRAMDESPDTRQTWARFRSRHLLVDEFQDITPTQFRMLHLMTGPTRSITIATDPNQSIYAWRGADPALMQQFELEHPNTSVHVLHYNHRSTQTLTQVAARLTDHESMSGLHHAYQTSIRPVGVVPTLLQFRDTPQDMDNHILSMAQQLHGQGHEWEDMAFIYRRHKTLERMVTNLSNRDIPYTVLGEIRIQKNSDASCITSLLTTLLNPMDATALAAAAATQQTSQRRRLNPQVLRQIRSISREQDLNLIQAAQVYQSTIKRNTQVHTDLQFATQAWVELDRMLDDTQVTLHQLCTRAHNLLHDTRSPTTMPIPEPQTSRLLAMTQSTKRLPDETPRKHLARFLENLSTAPNPDHRSIENDDPFAHHTGITFSTIHAAKGLQWSTVWFVDACHHIIPGQTRDKRDLPQKTLEEEQRTFYVATTRATDQLYYCAALGGQKGFEATPTQFLDALEDDITITYL